MAGTVNAPKKDPSYVQRLIAQLYDTDAANARNLGLLPELYKSRYNEDLPQVDGQINLDDPKISAVNEDILAGSNAAMAHPFSTKVGYTDSTGAQQINGFKNTLGVLGANIKAHPAYAIGTGINLGANVAGFMDNDKFGGQLAGLGIGALGNKFLFDTVNPVGQANIMMAAGALGSLFDKLRAKKEQEQQQYMYQ